jgi:hypothetical protein
LKNRRNQKRFERLEEERDRGLRDGLLMIKKYLVVKNYLWNYGQSEKQDIVRYEHLYNAFTLATGHDDPRTFNKRLGHYIDHGYFTKVKVVKTEAYRAEEKFFNL